MSAKHEQKTAVALLTGDVTSGIKRPLAVEIDIPPESTMKKLGVTFKLRMRDK
jgi:hypothetical protein